MSRGQALALTATLLMIGGCAVSAADQRPNTTHTPPTTSVESHLAATPSQTGSSPALGPESTTPTSGDGSLPQPVATGAPDGAQPPPTAPPQPAGDTAHVERIDIVVDHAEIIDARPAAGAPDDAVAALPGEVYGRALSINLSATNRETNPVDLSVMEVTATVGEVVLSPLTLPPATALPTSLAPGGSATCRLLFSLPATDSAAGALKVVVHPSPTQPLYPFTLPALEL